MRLRLQGELVSDEWAELYRWAGIQAGFYCAGDVLYAIDQLADGEELVLEINSIGGDVDSAAEIYSALQRCQHPTRAEITGLAASAASYMILACDRITIATPAQMMIHCASAPSMGNKSDHRWTADMLDTVDLSILDTYVARCGEQHREELQQMMEAETYLASGQCVALGLCDGITGTEGGKIPEDLPMVAAGVTGSIVRAMRTLPDLSELAAKRAVSMEMQQALEQERRRYQ